MAPVATGTRLVDSERNHQQYPAHQEDSRGRTWKIDRVIEQTALPGAALPLDLSYVTQ